MFTLFTMITIDSLLSNVVDIVVRAFSYANTLTDLKVPSVI
ncbi:hypothetical protein CAXC1_150031 [Candidatus Xenohaliotis californiensis]|uniref:Uncharacterized protein n=1 Tax=Candidatus Xenohaliotis californiensis TaxID=84677 RepID=A0ABM9N783_9RICK|nr:hypothetical protein CAXC1_150031 [Candidatus Xenohaliotis californiensis]